MKLASQVAVVLAVSIGLVACSGNDATDPGEEAPSVATLVRQNAPDAPVGRVLVCPVDGNSTVDGPTCEVLRWNGITYWTFSYDDLRNSVAVIGFDSDNNVVKELPEIVTTRFIWQITLNLTTHMVTLRGESGGTATFNWSELVVE